ncbi:hypothetical protein [Xenorhabdus thailandensis]|uniref:hypothetical protein n=1 Tax=Xenorhabdus thailandensis TaxID=3136255 RepID=UPI0030F41B33
MKNILIFLFTITFSTSLLASNENLSSRSKALVNIFNCAFYAEWLQKDDEFKVLINKGTNLGIPLIKEIKSHQLPNGNIPEEFGSKIPTVLLTTLFSSSPEFSLGMMYTTLNQVNKATIFRDEAGNLRTDSESRKLLLQSYNESNCNKLAYPDK